MDDQGTRGEWVRAALARYEAPLLRYASQFLGDGERARDVVQETFLQLCAADRAKVEGHLAAWLFRVCRNRAVDLRRKESRVESIDQHAGAGEALHSPGPDPSAMAERREGAGQVAAFLETLPASQREAVTLRFQGGLSYREISEVTGHSVSNVGVLLHEAIKRIRRHMDELAGSAAKTAGSMR